MVILLLALLFAVSIVRYSLRFTITNFKTLMLCHWVKKPC